MLRQLKLKVGIQGRTQPGERVIGGHSAVVEADRHIRAPLESLGVEKITRGRVLAPATKGAAAIELLAVELQRAREDGIEAGNGRTAAESRYDQTARADASTASGDRSSALA